MTSVNVRIELSTGKVQEKKSFVVIAKKKTIAKQQVLENCEAKTAAAKADVDAAKRKEHEAETELNADEVVSGELEEQKSKILQDLVEAENNLLILTEIEKLQKTREGRVKLPLAPEAAATSEDMRRAVSEFVPNFPTLISKDACPAGTLLKRL
jgi:hypothetical protein